MKLKAFTLVEMITVIVIMGILSAGTFVSLKHLYQRVAKSKALSELSFDSQIVLNQMSALLYSRVPISVIGYDKDGNFKSIYEITDENLTVLEWHGTASEYLKAGYYSGFVDMNASDRGSNTIVSYDLNLTLTDKFLNTSELALVFAGSFDDGELNEYNITALNDNNITLQTRPDEIYEKYYIVDSAYAVTRREDIENYLPCSDVNSLDNNNTLYLFYNYQPWVGDDFCDGNVTILSKEAKGFEVGLINDSIYFNLTLSRKIKGIDNNITISKQKVVF